MSIAFNIQAEVFDIRRDIPKANDIFLVDSNVWFWITYSRASLGDSPPNYYQSKYYPDYLKKARNVGAKLIWCGLSLAELSHLIEKTEREIYIKMNSMIRPKEFRHNLHAERKKVVDEIEASWGQVKSMADAVDTVLNEKVIDTMVNKIKAYPIDGYDVLIIESMISAGIVNVITDDGDYTTTPGIQVFTANQNVIDAATDSRMLLIR